MARPKSKHIYLAKWIEGRPESDVLEFEDDEWVMVLPFGSLPRKLAVEVLAADAHGATDDTSLQETQTRLRRERQNLLMPEWNLKNEYGELYPTPSADPMVWDQMSHNLEMFLSNLTLVAFETREDKRERVGEDSNSSAPSKELDNTISLMS